MIEREVEAYLIRKVKRYNCKCLKWVSPGCNGVPDRIVILPGGEIHFVETKKPGSKPRPIQVKVMAELKHLGCSVRVLDSRAAVDKFIEEVMTDGTEE